MMMYAWVIVDGPQWQTGGCAGYALLSLLLIPNLAQDCWRLV